jgi:hypothetical protein
MLTGTRYGERMSEWTTAWDNPDRDSDAGGGTGAAVRYVGWTGGAFAIAAAFWLFLFASGLFTTLGSVEGSERHGTNLVRLADESSFGLGTIYAFRGQRLWWDYDVAVEGKGGVRLRIAKVVPSPDFIVRAQDVAATGRGRFEVIAPESGFYSFDQERIPQGVLIGPGEAGSTRYDLSWGVD